MMSSDVEQRFKCITAADAKDRPL